MKKQLIYHSGLITLLFLFGMLQTIFSQTVNFSTKTDFTAGTSPANVTIGDLNGDGKPDIVIPNSGTDASISVFMNTTAPLATTPSFSAKTDFLTGAAPVSAAIGDINGDGKPDIVVAVDGAMKVAVFLNTTATGASIPTFSTRTDFAAIYSPYLVKLADLNGDGKLDIVVADYYAKKVSVFINTTTTGASIPTFATRKDFPAGQYTSCIAVGDLNGDGKPDIAASNDGDNTVSVLINKTTTGDTTVSFYATSNFPVGTKPVGVAIADLNGNGKPDLVVTNQYDLTASVLLNTTKTGDTTATFSAKTDFNTGGGPISVAIGDMNGDGKPDIVSGNYSSNSVSVLLNTTTTGASTASFSDKTDFTTGANPRGIAIADLNGDGKLDIVSANYLSAPPSMSVLFNTTSSVPVELTTFTAALNNGSVELNWKTATETNNYGFEIQKSQTQNHNWTKIGFVKGAGNSTSPLAYYFVDNTVPYGSYAYRLKQIDITGEYKYSSVVEVNVGQAPNDFSLSQNYPNPFNPSTVIKYSIPQNGFVSIKVFNLIGLEVATLVNQEQKSGIYMVNFDASKLASGVYMYRIQAGGFSLSKKMTILK